MKIKAKQELHAKTIEELEQLLRQAKEELMRLKLEKAQKKLKNTSSINRKSKDMAIVNTILNEKRYINEKA